MSIVCTLEPKVNLFKSGSAPTKNVLLLKNKPSSAAAAAAAVVIKNYNNNILHTKEKTSLKTSFEAVQRQQQQQQLRNPAQDYKPRISVADFVVRQQQQHLTPHESNVNGDFFSHHTRIPTAMPTEVLSVATNSPTITTTTSAFAAATTNNNNNNIINNNNNNNIINNNNNNKLSLNIKPTIVTPGSASIGVNMNNSRMSSVSPSLSMNGSSNEATNVHGLSMYGPMSPQSSDSGHSMSENMSSHLNVNGKFSNGYDGHMTKAQHNKELFTQRKQREFTPDNKKDDSYWDRRRRNNEAAKRSREKRRYNDMVLEQRVVELTKENHVLKAQLDAIRDKFNISGENLVSVEQILASLPTSEQVLSVTKRAKLTSGGSGCFNGVGGTSPTGMYTSNTSNGSGGASPQKQQEPQQPHVMKPISHPAHLPPHSHSVSPVMHQQHLHHMQPQAVQHYQTPVAADSYPAAAEVATQNPGLANPVSTTTAASLPQNLHVLQALNRSNVSCDDLDNLRKVVAVVGATISNSSAAELPPSVNTLYSGASPAPLYGTQQANVFPQNMDLGSYPEATVSSSAVDAVSSSSPGIASVLNLSRRACTPNYEHLLSSTTGSFRLSSSLSCSGSSSGAVSGDDEHEAADDRMVVTNNCSTTHHIHSSSNSPSNNDANNCLPLKLRHKSHLGDKDAAATALLALQHIKQEPASNRASPPGWTDGGDNSSDERDSGISIGSTEWTAQFQRKIPESSSTVATASVVAVIPTEREHLLKSQLARLESEVASIKNMMSLSTEPATDLKI